MAVERQLSIAGNYLSEKSGEEKVEVVTMPPTSTNPSTAQSPFNFPPYDANAFCASPQKRPAPTAPPSPTAPPPTTRYNINYNEEVSVEGSGDNNYLVKNCGGDVFSCTCKAWKMQKKGPHELRKCKHIKKVLGAESTPRGCSAQPVSKRSRWLRRRRRRSFLRHRRPRPRLSPRPPPPPQRRPLLRRTPRL